MSSAAVMIGALRVYKILFISSTFNNKITQACLAEIYPLKYQNSRQNLCLQNQENALFKVYHTQNLMTGRLSVDPNEVAHCELPHLNLHCFKFTIFSFLALLKCL